MQLSRTDSNHLPWRPELSEGSSRMYRETPSTVVFVHSPTEGNAGACGCGRGRLDFCSSWMFLGEAGILTRMSMFGSRWIGPASGQFSCVGRRLPNLADFDSSWPTSGRREAKSRWSRFRKCLARARPNTDRVRPSFDRFRWSSLFFRRSSFRLRPTFGPGSSERSQTEAF